MPIPGAAFRQFTGVVVSAGKLPKCVKVRIAAQKWDKHIKKYFPAPYHVLCSDPTQSVQEGDVIQLRNGFRTSRTIRHVVTSIISPFGTPITERPPIPTEEERQAQLRYERLKRDIKQAANGRVAPNQRLRDAARLDGNLMHALKVAEKKGEEPPQEVQEAVARLEAEEARIAELWEKEQPFEDYLFGDSSKESIIEIPQGQLYLVRPLSVKGYSELIFKDAAASIRRTGQEFQYQLVIQRAYEEGERELLEEEEDPDNVEGTGIEKDERTFLLDEALRLRTDVRSTGEQVFAWKDLSGDEGDLWEFVCDSSVQASTIASFELVAVQCQYERKFRKSHTNASEQDLKQFYFEEEGIPDASPVSSPRVRSPVNSPSPDLGRSSFSLDQPAVTIDTMVSKPTPQPESSKKATTAPESRPQPKSREVLSHEKAELHLFDFESGAFILQDSEVVATVSEIGNWDYWLHIASDKKEWLGQPVVPDINPVFNFEYLSFIFNHYTEDGSAFSWLLRFHDQETEERFQQGLMQALWEHLNQVKWSKAKDDERDYVLEAFQDLTVDDEKAGEEEEEEEEEDEEDRPRAKSYESDEDDEEDEEVAKDADGNVNSQLAVGYKHDRSFVVRGSKIGVFKHTDDNHLEFSTNISKVETPKGNLFSPKKVMLHMEDRDMILQNPDNPNSLYRMDLERGQVVDEWKIHDDIPKYSQMTGEQTFLGLSRNALYRVDPRLSGNKLVDSEWKQYTSKNDFSAAATTEKGYIAVASNKGDIRMFDRLGINAKTALPQIGDPIIGVDVSADGRWVLATTRTYLLLIDALQSEGKNEGKLGFEKAFPKDAKPQPRRLALTPSHVAQFQHETKSPISFTPARFNAGVESEETNIITASGPFVITWSLKKVLAGRKDPYSIKRYSEEVKADNFRFGSDKNVIVALPNEVDMVNRRALRRPTRESIAMPSRIGTPKRATRGSYLSRNEIVNSPY
ncbi:vacuolar import and degradation protein [Phyllosticta citricarpa]